MAERNSQPAIPGVLPIPACTVPVIVRLLPADIVPLLLAVIVQFLLAAVVPLPAVSAVGTDPPPAHPAAAGEPRGAGGDRPVRPETGTREVVNKPTWKDGAVLRFTEGEAAHWRVVAETAITGWYVLPTQRRPISQTRLRIEEDRPGKSRILAWVQHTANTEISLLQPGDPRLSRIGAASDDSLRPWPNACTLLPDELDHAIDLNHNGRPELPVRSSVSLSDPAAACIVLLEADAGGFPRIVASSEFIGTVRFDEGVITAIRFPARDAEPVLEGQLLSLYNCRFLARLDVRGQEACRTCCLITIVFRRDEQGRFSPIYDKTAQVALLNRTRDELARVEPDRPDPLTPREEVVVCRAAAFFYLTGLGNETRGEMETALGKRARQPQTAQLMNRLDRFFLKDPD